MESCNRPADDSQQVREVRRTDWGARLRQASEVEVEVEVEAGALQRCPPPSPVLCQVPEGSRSRSGRIWRPGQHRACTVLTLISQEKIMLRGCSKQGCWLGTRVHGTRLCPWVRPVARGCSARRMMTAPGSSSQHQGDP